MSSLLGALRLGSARVLAARALAPAAAQARPVRAAFGGAIARQYGTPHPSESFLNGTSAVYLEHLYDQFLQDPSSVHLSWRTYFETGMYSPPPGLSSLSGVTSRATETSGMGKDAIDHIRVTDLILAYQIRGHELANLDPLQLREPRDVPELSLEYHGLTQSDLNREFLLTPQPLFDDLPGPYTLGYILDRVKSTYCGTMGFEYMFIDNRVECNWLREFVERPAPLAEQARRDLYDRLTASTLFEAALKRKHPNEKRFGLEGCEMLIPAMKRLIGRLSESGTDMVVLGMPHRGRLNVLHNVLRKDMARIFHEFDSNYANNEEGSGDVKYHKGSHARIVVESTMREIELLLLANPSHLEAVNPVVEGRVRAEQYLRNDTSRSKVVPVLIHGDASYAGQGVVYETDGMAMLPDYTTGGTIHIVCNNQIGFTTDPRTTKYSSYATSIARVSGSPIIHVNADDCEAVIRACDIAAAYRQRFNKDFVIDLIGYRRHGHNEADEPKFTQPFMYSSIEKHPPVLSLYRTKLLDEGVLSQEHVTEIESQLETAYDEAFTAAKEGSVHNGEKKNKFVDRAEVRETTGVDTDLLRQIGVEASSEPDGYELHKQLKKILKARRDSIETGSGIDWATGEMLAFGSLLSDGVHVRLSGQDVERGTFSQRHHVLHDQREEKDGEWIAPLQHLSTGNSTYQVTNSHLSEYAVLGFELGYSLATHNQLVCWEAQFGDFNNTAQVIFDQFISSGGAKWEVHTNLVTMLPHGFEGMGPEHSSGRPERFLQMCNDCEEEELPYEKAMKKCNWIVANATTPANFFHMLRRQVYGPVIKPLIVFTPKSLLRLPAATSTLEEFGPGTAFQPVLGEASGDIDADKVKRVVFCTGKVYYDLLKARSDQGITDVALCRVEQLSPFPHALVREHADRFPNATDIVWAQEEPRNMGGWSFVDPRLETALSSSSHHAGRRPRYVGRVPSSTPATGDKNVHKKEQAKLVSDAITI